MEYVEIILFFIGAILYVITLINDKIFAPNPISFGIWLAIDILNVLTYRSFSTHIIVPIVSTFGVCFIFVLSLYRVISRKKTFTVTVADYICMVIVGICIVLYYAINGIAANALVQVMLIIGFIPIIDDLLKGSRKEPVLAWFFLSIGYLCLSIDTASTYCLKDVCTYKGVVELSYPILQGCLGCGFVSFLAYYKRGKASQ